uniref:N-acetyltransferase domain-containing protein n=2 Tax=Panagrellus redivivus TaxID=6233 RepID=A0A7E4W059_PANRE
MLKAKRPLLSMALIRSNDANSELNLKPLRYRRLNLSDLEQYKQLLRDNKVGYIGFLFKDLCDNIDNAFYVQGAFDGNDNLIGLIVGIRNFENARPVPVANHQSAKSSSNGQKQELAHIVTVLVDKAYRRRKIGTTLLDYFTRDILTDANQRQIYTVAPKDVGTFFTGNKFKEIAEVEGFYNGQDGGILVVKQLNSKFLDA